MLTFGSNKDLEITEDVKVVEAIMHNNDERVTLVYHGLGAFTFNLMNAMSLANPSDWVGQYEERDFKVPLKFSSSRDLISGKGKDIDDEDMHL